jgi:DNA replication protein DnaC
MDDEEVSARKARELDAAKQKVESTFQRIIERHANEATVQEDYPDELRQFLEAEATRAKEERAENVRRARLEKWDEKVPEVWRGWSIDQLPLKFQQVCLEWLATGFDNSQNIIITGGTGSGKTTMAYALSREIYAQGFKAKMWNVRELIAALNPKAAAAHLTLESTKTCPLLLLDDLGSEKKSEWTSERILEILDYRWQWKKPTIITTNLVLEGDDNSSLEGWIGDRAYSRISAGALKLTFKGGDKRV